MRSESLMTSTKPVLVVAVVVAAAFGIMVAPFVALPLIAVVVALVIAARRRDQPIAAEAAQWGRRWYLWLATAAILFLVGSAMLLTADDGDLSTAPWAIWLLSWLAAAVIAAVGLGLGVTHLLNDRRSHIVSTRQ